MEPSAADSAGERETGSLLLFYPCTPLPPPPTGGSVPYVTTTAANVRRGGRDVSGGRFRGAISAVMCSWLANKTCLAVR